MVVYKVKYSVGILFFIGLLYVLYTPVVFAIDEVRIAALGTSLTKRGGWVVPLEKSLGECQGSKVNILNLAISGATSREGLEKLDDLLEYKPDIVLMEFSVNDADYFRGVSLSESLNNLDHIIRSVRSENKNVKIILMVMNPVFGIRSWIRPMLGKYRYRHIVFARENNIDYFDYRPRWMEVYEGDFEKVIPDGLHPTSQSAELVIVPVLERLIEDKCFN